ncbi:MAG: hypothetical protein ACF8PN_05005 [Phycisphaerales bacterium]
MSRPTPPHAALALVDEDELDRYYQHAAAHLLQAADELIRARRTLAALGLDHELVEWLIEDAVNLSDLAEDIRHPGGRIELTLYHADGTVETRRPA